MKRILVLLVATMITTSVVGCGLFNRGASCASCPTSTGAFYGGDEMTDGAYMSNVSPQGILPTPN